MTDATVALRRPGRGFALPHFLTSEHPFPWLAPITAMLLIFGVYPLLYALWLSLHKRNPATRISVFDPEHNWVKVLSDDRMWGAIGHTYVLLDTDRKGYGVLRALMTLPLVVPPAVTGMMFLLMLDGSFGVLSRGLYATGILSPSQPILASSGTALMGILLTDIWQWTPFMVLIMMAGLRALPKDPYEAAAIDGATAVQAFFKLTLPLLSKIIAIAVLIRGVDLFRIYDYVKVMTEGGPGTSTETLTAYAGTIYFKNADFPYASTIALFTLILVVVTSSIFIKLFKVKF
ncbi:MAG: sugar ABC transporter permease [Bradyrhizobium sp.]|nr:sugar ABC transporter permease [Bradyrhizobium sp.]